MNLNDLLPYFELYQNLKTSGEDTILNEKLQQKEEAYINKEISVTGIVSEIDRAKNELIITYRADDGSSGNLNGLISSHFFIFSSSENLPVLISEFNIQKEDFVRVSGKITSLHRQSVMRLQLSSVSVLKKNVGIVKRTAKKGCFIATAVYGSCEAEEVIKFYRLRDEVLYQSFFGRLFVCIYYIVSPTLAKWIDDKPAIKSFIRKYILDRILNNF
ncbi:MAG TPA: CFI-box-CTERM domain-containing protein [Puia sp.]|nr:CFI-box-CTERM domain-containing protein [Puia sp.]